MALWNQVAKTTEKLGLDRKDTFLDEELQKPSTKQFTIQESFQVGIGAHSSSPKNDVLPQIQDQLAFQPIKMDKKTHQRLKSGKLKPEARIDLHGMTLAQAHPRLTRFILSAHGEGKRLVLVITGKGKNTDNGGPIPVRHGILRHAVPQWLAQAPLSSLVLQITQAHNRHGGGGAYYVYLRRAR
ncbi:Smr/MutS family protein [Roseovarius rhodophyticola]|uniref:Smr/MutS family protein n=1 Tax=Roseovarius rhodophyticola TaxID=3080827 RepID=A0ABZ2TJB3_9RHOB|nr:Smr/MutS family protein [Roseovarius sp. W115]MDV2930051.1 Smr/MutS family protein [Roseovarius sp. W115]